MPQLQEPSPDFASLYAVPSIQRMLDELSDHQFEHFVKYAFEQAGYAVEDMAGHHGKGLDLGLVSGPDGAKKLHGGISVKHFVPDGAVNGPQVQGFRGALKGKVGYVVTTGTFNDPARKEANEEPCIWLIDGEHFVRYINYVRGSRAVAAADTEPDSRLRARPLAPIPPEALLAADDIMRHPIYQTKVLTLANHKGGVGKTTSALNLAFGLAALDQQVLLVDMDAQANLTKSLPAQTPGAVQRHIGEYFTGKRRLVELIRQTQFPRVWLIPSHHDLTLSDKGSAAGPGAELRFVRDLHAPEIAPPPVLDGRPFDWIILDTSPSMSFFTRLALAASHYVLMPLTPGVFADTGEELLRRTIRTMEALTGMDLVLLGGLITQWRDDALNRQFLAVIERSLHLMGRKVPVDKNIERAHLDTGAGKKKNLFDKKCEAAKAYLEIVDEVVRDVQSGPDRQARAGADHIHA
jgi:chromosome partitioning protein